MDFDAWMLNRAKEKPNNPLYAHLQARAALSGGDVVESPKDSNVVSPGRLAEPLKNIEEVDFKLKAAGEDDDWDAQEVVDEELG